MNKHKVAVSLATAFSLLWIGVTESKSLKQTDD